VAPQQEEPGACPGGKICCAVPKPKALIELLE
jgi:hypothetical protein